MGNGSWDKEETGLGSKHGGPINPLWHPHSEHVYRIPAMDYYMAPYSLISNLIKYNLISFWHISHLEYKAQIKALIWSVWNLLLSRWGSGARLVIRRVNKV